MTTKLDAAPETIARLQRELADAHARIAALEDQLEQRAPAPDGMTRELAARKRATGEYGL